MHPQTKGGPKIRAKPAPEEPSCGRGAFLVIQTRHHHVSCLHATLSVNHRQPHASATPRDCCAGQQYRPSYSVGRQPSALASLELDPNPGRPVWPSARESISFRHDRLRPCFLSLVSIAVTSPNRVLHSDIAHRAIVRTHAEHSMHRPPNPQSRITRRAPSPAPACRARSAPSCPSRGAPTRAPRASGAARPGRRGARACPRAR
jgi:hypothetical protein